MQPPSVRGPVCSSLLVYPTHRCNLKCGHCYFAPTYDEKIGRQDGEVSCELIYRAIDALVPFGLKVCKLSGGEPFLRDDLMNMCRYADGRGVRIVIETNGTLVTQRHAEALACLKVKACVSVSIDGAKSETHEALRGVPGSFGRALEGLGHLVASGAKVQVIAAAYQGNQTELLRIIDLAKAKGATSFKVCFVRGVGRGRNLPLIGCEEGIALDEQLAVYAKSVGIRYFTSLPVSVRSAARILELRALRDRCSVTSTLGILADGTISICGMGRYAKDFQFGKLGEDDIATIWLTHPVLKTIRECVPQRLHGVCGRCIARSACGGYCRIENEHVTLQSFFDPYPLCAQAEKLGLIAPSRFVERPTPPAEEVTCALCV